MVATDAWGQRSHYLRWQRTSKHLLDDIKLFYPGLTDLKVLQVKARKGEAKTFRIYKVATPLESVARCGGWEDGRAISTVGQGEEESLT